MRRLSAAFLLAVAACSSASAPPPEPAPGSIRARFLPGSAQDVIEVTMRDRMAARSVALAGPGGLLQPAYAIETQPARRSARVYGGLSPAASAFGIAGAPSTTTVTDEAATTAFVRVPDVFDYRQNWQSYRIRVEIGTPPDGLRAVTVPAPPPPA
jgi:hypothetical protein